MESLLVVFFLFSAYLLVFLKPHYCQTCTDESVPILVVPVLTDTDGHFEVALILTSVLVF